MNPKKQKAKDRRRARVLAEQAWEAANQGNLDLAEKIIRRAVSTQEDNPVLWNDQGVILGLRHKDSEAAKSFAAALSLAPTFADPYAHLATLRLRQGRVEEALGLQTQAVKYAPQNAPYAEQLQAYQALAGQLPPHADSPAVATVDPTEVSSADPGNDWPQRLGTLDWHALANRLTRDGCAVIAGMVDAPTCEWLRGLFDDDRLFSKTVVMDRPEFGKGAYRYFGAPIPKVVDQLRRAVYPHVARIANEWQQMLGDSESFPEEWDSFRDRCHSRGPDDADADPAEVRPWRIQCPAPRFAWRRVLPDPTGCGAEPACRPGGRGHTRLPRRRVPVLRFSRTKKVAPPGSRARPRRCGAVLHSRPSRSHGWRRRIAAGQARRCPNHRGHSVRARRAVP